MRTIFFDSGPIITLTMNNLLWLLPELEARYKGEFMITPGVRQESVERGLHSKKFMFEAMQILRHIEQHDLDVYDEPTLKTKTLEMLTVANNIFSAHGNTIKIVHYTEMEVICAAKMLGSDAVVIDEFVTRGLIEDPFRVRTRLHRKLHLKIHVDQGALKKFSEYVKGIKAIRSVELVIIAYEHGLLDKFLVDIPESKAKLLDALLWGVKLSGCSLSSEEIKEIMKFEKV